MLKDRTWFARGGRHGLENRISDLKPMVEKFDASGMTALDAGAAEGDISIWLSRYFSQVTAIELMNQAYSALEKRAEEQGRVTAIHADISEWDTPGQYDCVFLLGVLHYFPSDGDKRRILEKYLSRTRYLMFSRTGIREHKLRDGLPYEKAKYYTPLDMLPQVCGGRFEYTIVDNAHRGDGDRRLGDLIVFRRRGIDNPTPSLEELISRQ